MVKDGRQYVYIGFGSTQLELNDGNLCLFYPSWATGGSHDVLVKNDAFNKFCVFYCASDLLDDSDIPKINVR